jgi:hypothetical protein
MVQERNILTWDDSIVISISSWSVEKNDQHDSPY